MDLFKKIREKINDKKEELKIKDEIKKEARLEALNEAKPELKEMYKKKEKNKILGIKEEKGEKKDWMKKLADGFGGNQGTNNKVSSMLSGSGSFRSTEDIANMMGGTSRKSTEGNNNIKKVKAKIVDVDDDDEFNVNDKLKRMLS